jgi:hypothetical protein
MTQYASADDLMAFEPETKDVALPNGKHVKVRGLTRYEHMLIGKGTDDANEIESRMLRMAVLEPVLTEKQVDAWRKKAGARTVGRVSEAIRELSGFNEGADKSHSDSAGE